MSAIKGDFTGFTFNGIHSSELGLTRVSDGSRYGENLYPNIQDKTVQVPGGDGTYYFGSFYTQRTFNISVVFDNLTEEQLVKIRQVFGDKKIHDLIFDEVPYKIYRVKSTGTPNLKYVCFNKDVDEFDRDYQDNNEIWSKKELYGVSSRSPYGRIYKGEGQLNFVAYYPFARSRFKYIDDYTLANIPEWGSMDADSANEVHYNLYDWVDSIGLKRSDLILSQNDINYQIDIGQPSGVMIYNPGDFPTDFELTFLYATNTFYGCIIGLTDFNINNYLTIESFRIKDEDDGIRINGKLNLIEGVYLDEQKTEYKKVKTTSGKKPGKEHWYYFDGTKWQRSLETVPDPKKTYYIRIPFFSPTGTIYNEHIIEGDFFKIPVLKDLTLLSITPLSQTLSGYELFIKYDYLFY